MRTLKISPKFVFSHKILFLNFLFFTMICSPMQAQADINDLSSALSTLKTHMEGSDYLTADQITEQTEIIKNNIGLIGQNDTIISQAFNLVETYEREAGPLFINAQTSSGFRPNDHTGVEFDWAMFQVQQGLLDYAYTPENIKQYTSILDGAKYETSEYFPGGVEPPADSTASYQVDIKCTMGEVWWGSPVMYCQDVARRPTGAYLSPGTIAEVIVPASIVDKGFKIRVGAHSWDFSNKPRYKRLNRVSLTYPIDSTVVQVANPLGGGIYIEVPYKAEHGIQTIEFKNTVRSPFFSARSFDKTTLEEWQNEERHHPGPWADFESDKFMMQVPTKWIYNYDDPVSLMEDWDTSMDAVTELFGRPRVLNITVLYVQPDVLIRGSAYFPGYPQTNTTFSPTRDVNGNKNHYFLKGPQYAPSHTFHELGHAQLFTKFAGETEAAVNVPYVAVQNGKFGMPLNEAFGRSFRKPNMTLDKAALNWMVTENFRQGDRMESSQMAYQHRGYAKYVEIARIFGWEALSKFWHSVQEDYLNGISYPRNSDPDDSRIFRMSEAAGADLAPLIHFWGIPPKNAKALKSRMAAERIPRSAEIYDMLHHYQEIIPRNKDKFADYSEHGPAAIEAIEDIINFYFPYGRPDPEADPYPKLDLFPKGNIPLSLLGQ